ncbi:NCS1 family nucleobase:cation symporter-1 [Segniliparus rugosus]|uniref:NCS1 nucleoside transporter n=1 Tax=Segniliparus rugosus (strain ATCC BAA-974 / DSM 45345 / CCUG 50838 / CIP 108380 / JCM 13579 / CDC 945) TaxID=679197 RepID=E5XQ33_SEGRC|nr:NCS1 family nucleobase:cation symporter-1 [Segniliparus rugosus]EFV13542.1 NCS1 nucleoside transporter [Segniliparus rugosus ATCC BAA-974]
MTAVLNEEPTVPADPVRDPRLTNEDLAPAQRQDWGVYNFVAFWMTDIHSVAGYTTAGSLFALGLAGWQVFVALIAAVSIAYVLANLVAEPSQRTGAPYPVVCRLSFGVLGANIPAILRGINAVAWYGMQTYLAANAVALVLVKLFRGLVPYADASAHGFLGLSAVGWATFMGVWTAQALIFWHGMDFIRAFVDWAGPAVYVVMIVLCGWLLYQAGWGAVRLDLSEGDGHGGSEARTGAETLCAMVGAVGLVVSYFGGPVLNFGDFAKYGKSMKVIRTSGLFGLPVNFLFFSLLVVATASLTAPVFGELVVDPNEVVVRIPNSTAMVVGVLTILVATIGINIVANFVSPAFDFSNACPQRISWLGGGMIAAVASVFIAPWKLIENPAAIHDTLETLGAFLGALYGVLVVDYYLVRRRRIVADDLYSMAENGSYWYTRGCNLKAVAATAFGGAVAVACVLVGGPGSPLALHTLAQCSWFVGAALAGLAYWLIARSPAKAQKTPIVTNRTPQN